MTFIRNHYILQYFTIDFLYDLFWSILGHIDSRSVELGDFGVGWIQSMSTKVCCAEFVIFRVGCHVLIFEITTSYFLTTDEDVQDRFKTSRADF
jgi:hypothetical protein